MRAQAKRVSIALPTTQANQSSDAVDSDVEILAVHEEDIVRSYLFEVRSPSDVSKAVSAAQHRLLQEARSMGFNALWREG